MNKYFCLYGWTFYELKNIFRFLFFHEFHGHVLILFTSKTVSTLAEKNEFDSRRAGRAYKVRGRGCSTVGALYGIYMERDHHRDVRDVCFWIMYRSLMR